MLNKTNLIYLILLGILVILIIAVVAFPAKEQNATQTFQDLPTPTTVQVLPSPTSNTPIPIISPTNTGGNEDVPQPTLDYSLQKETLRRKTSLKTVAFTISFDYSNDRFIVTPNSPNSLTSLDSPVFQSWLKQNYPLLPMSQFVLQ